MNYAQLLFPDFSLIVLGYVLCRFTPLGRSLWQSVEALVYYLLFPAMLFHSIVKSPLDWASTSSLITAGVLMGLVGIGLSYALPHIGGLRQHIPRDEHAASAQVAFRFNSFIGLALAERLAGPQGLVCISVLIGFCVPLFNVAAVWPMARGGQHHFWQQLVHNPLVVATLAGLLANVLGLRVPTWITPALERLGAASIALGLLTAGASLQLGLLAQAKCLAVAVLTIRHAVLPLVALCLAWWLGVRGEQAMVLLMFAALPTASSCYVLASRMGMNGPYVAGLVTVSTLLGVVSLPWALQLYQLL